MYSSKKQEQYYQTERVYVTREFQKPYWHSPGHIEWRAVRFDTVTHEILSESNNITKADAIDMAKAMATRMGLPFNLQTDLIEYAELAHGPELHCVGCGEKWWDNYWQEWKRGFESSLCPGCRGAVEVGRQTSATRHTYIWSGQDHTGQYAVKFRNAAVKLAQTVEGEFERHCDHKDRIIGEYNSHGQAHTVSITDVQTEAIEELIALHLEVKDDAYRSGYFDGSSILHQLAVGKVSPNDFADIREEK